MIGLKLQKDTRKLNHGNKHIAVKTERCLQITVVTYWPKYKTLLIKKVIS